MNPRTLGKATIMVIDESDAVLASVRGTLEAAGFRVVTQARVAGAVAAILHEKPDLVLIDLTSQGASGEIVVKLFGREQPNSETLVLMHSSLPDEAARPRALAAGAHGHLQKNDDSFELLRQIGHWLKVGVRTSHSKLKAISRPEDDETANRPSGARLRLGAKAGVPVDVLPASLPSRQSSGTLRLDLPLVLFIDDDMGTLSGFRREVQAEAYSVEFALSGPRAIERIVSLTPPDLIVSDLLMPAPAGPEIYRQAVAFDRSWEGRFIFVTGAGLLSEMAGFLSGFRGLVLDKPVRGDDLRAAIRRSLERRARGRAVPDGNAR